MLHGGLLGGRPYLLVGPSGTGKTTLALRFLIEGARQGEETLIVTLEEPPNEMRFNHRVLQPELDKVWVFDAIPDVMRYERTPFKDVAQVRDAARFATVGREIRRSPELASVEVTLTALEQTLKMQCARRHYRRLVIDSLTALQYFCMKGFDESVGAQSFLRFLVDLKLTTLLIVESGWEDLETPERMLARGEIRLFRWEHDGATVRAIGVEKFRGSSHDVRLHPYRIGARGLDIRLDETISRDTRMIARILPGDIAEEHVAPLVVTVGSPPPVVDAVGEILDGITQEIQELARARLDLGAIRGSLDHARQSLVDGQLLPAQKALIEARGLVRQMTLGYRSSRPAAEHELRPPKPLPDLPDRLLPHADLKRMVDNISSALPATFVPAAPVGAAARAAPPAPPEPIAEVVEPAPVAPAIDFRPEPPRTLPPSPPSTVPLGVLTGGRPPDASGPAATTPRSAPAGPVPSAPALAPPPPGASPVAARPALRAEPAPIPAAQAGAVSFGPTFESLEVGAPAAPSPAGGSGPAPAPPPPVPAPSPPATAPDVAAPVAPTVPAGPATGPTPIPGLPVAGPALSELSAPADATLPKRRKRAAGSTTGVRRRRSTKATGGPAAGTEDAPAHDPSALPAPPKKRRSPRRKPSAKLEPADPAVEPGPGEGTVEPPPPSPEVPGSGAPVLTSLDTTAAPVAGAPTGHGEGP